MKNVNGIQREALNTYWNKKYTEDFNEYISRIRKNIETMTGQKINPMGRSITIQVTDACNLYCSYCYQINKGKNVLSLENGKKFIDLLLTDNAIVNDHINQYNSDIPIIDFIGGEPLLEIDLIDQITDYLIQRMIELDHPWLPYYQLSIGTNGTLYFDPKFQKYLNKHKGKLSVNITVDGNKKLHDSCRVFADGSGSYDKAVDAVKHWNEFSGVHNPSTKLTIAPGNVEYLSEAIINMIDLGFHNVNENCVYEEGWTIDHAKILYYELKKVADYLIDNDMETDHTLKIFEPVWYQPMDPSDNQNWCGGDGRMLAVDPHGNLFNCLRYMESSLGSDAEPLIIGHVDRGIGVTEKDKQNLHCMQCITRKSQSTDECFNCSIASGCGWCTGYNYQKFGTCDKRATYVCVMHKASSLATSYYWNKLFNKYSDIDEYAKRSRFNVNCKSEDAIEIVGEEEYKMLLNLSRLEGENETES